MSGTATTFTERLRTFASDLTRWQAEADRLRIRTENALSAGQVEEDALVEVEASASLLYEEIKIFDVLMREVSSRSPTAADELAPVKDALRLLLLEVTELGTRLYSIRSEGIGREGSTQAAHRSS